MKKFQEVNLVTHPTVDLPTYDPTKLMKGTMIDTFTRDGDTFFGPNPVSIARPMEESVPNSMYYPYVLDMNDTTQWIFGIVGAATAIPRMTMYEFNKQTLAYSYRGYVQITTGIAGNQTVRGFRIALSHYSTGTVTVAGTAVTGVGTPWITERMNPGAVIGFGSTDPDEILAWYEIASVDSETGITLVSDAGTIPAGTPYLIREMMAVVMTTCATVGNAGLFLVKGLSELDFTANRIFLMGTADLQKAHYRLTDAAVLTNTVAIGVALDDKTSQTSQLAYVGNVTAPNVKFYVYNIRAPLTTVTTGASTNAWVFVTGLQAYTGTMSQSNNGRIDIINHGPIPGEKSLFLATTSRVYQCPIDLITSGSLAFLTHVMVEIAAGGANSMPITNAIQSVEVGNQTDMLFLTTTNAAGAYSWYTRFKTTAESLDIPIFLDTKVYNSTLSDSAIPIVPNTASVTMQMFAIAGFLHILRASASNLTNHLFCLPYIVDNQLDLHELNDQYVITPEMSTVGATKFYRAVVSRMSRLGSDVFSMPLESFKVYQRTSGIDDNTGAWTLVPEGGDMSSVTPAASIQFKITFRIFGVFCIPARLFSIFFTYEDNLTDSHYEASLTRSSAASRIFAWRQKDLFTGTVPKLDILIYDTADGSLLLTDDTDLSAHGIWEYSLDGSLWNAWDDSQDLVGNYIRYIANSLPSGTKVRVTLIQAS